MEHTIYLSAKAFIEAVGPCTPKNKSTKDSTVPVEGEVHEDEEDIYDNKDVRGRLGQRTGELNVRVLKR